jgi:hypothetical protein
MRLVNTQTLEVEDFSGRPKPIYAILSHTWETDEVLFADMADLEKARGKQGFAKVEGACELARAKRYEYIWIDTCCIDKSSSSELSEAISSMYQWYQCSRICIAYLSDVERRDDIHRSRWFKRGWTLQELIAPTDVDFFSKNWVYLGSKRDRGFGTEISAASSVDECVLTGIVDPTHCSVARRMYWASMRSTTRVEDEAYCLLGLFGVNMPLIYGEGRNAFRRLLEAIIKVSNDQSILSSWVSGYVTGEGALPSRAEWFRHSWNIALMPHQRGLPGVMQVTQAGVEVEMIIARKKSKVPTNIGFSHMPTILGLLDCQAGPLPGTLRSIALNKVQDGKDGKLPIYTRIAENYHYQTFFLANSLSLFGSDGKYGRGPFRVTDGFPNATTDTGKQTAKLQSHMVTSILPNPSIYPSTPTYLAYMPTLLGIHTKEWQIKLLGSVKWRKSACKHQ